VWTKAAALVQSLMNGHPLVDGNKRLGWLVTAVFLELNGASVVAVSNDEVHDLVMRVAGGSPSIEEIAAALRELGS
jgi:death on curing protein